MDFPVGLNPKLCENINEKFQKQIIKLAVRSLSNANIDGGIAQRLQEENNIGDEDFCDLVGLYITIINLYMSKSKEEFVEVLLNAGFQQNFIENLPFKQEDKNFIAANIQGESNVQLDYKVDISLSNNVLRKVVPPCVIFNLKRNEKTTTFSTDSATFHKLRYNLALILKELNAVKNMNILKK